MGVVGRSYRCRILTFYVIILDKKIVEVYEAAVKNYPTNEEFLTQLFMAYVRVGDCVKQQQVGERERETEREWKVIFIHSLPHLFTLFIVDCCSVIKALSTEWPLLLLENNEHINAGIPFPFHSLFSSLPPSPYKSYPLSTLYNCT